MKSLTIAIKDLTRSFRSTFALIFMFGIPLLVTGMFYLMFGNIANTDESNMAATKVVVVNLDEGNDQAGQLGQNLMDSLQNEGLSSVMEVSVVDDAATARQMVESQQAGVALIVPATFSSSFPDSNGIAEIKFYQDPTLTIGPQIVASVVNQFIDNFAGIKIMVSEALKQAEKGALSYDQIDPLVSQYLTTSESSFDARNLIDERTPDAKEKTNPMVALIGPIMGGMMIFYAFFTGVNTANSILREDEEGTLARLFTTPTSQREVLTGKFLSVGLTVLVQVSVLILAARLIFGIYWGSLPAVALVALGIVCSASTFGILVCSLMKSTKQGGVIFGGLMTVTGMVGMMNIFTGNPNSSQFGIVPLFVPQGWAAKAMLSAMGGGLINHILSYTLVLIVMSILFFIIGVWRFQKRYA